MFRLLAGQILKEGGVVYGAAFNEKMEVHHQRVDSETGLETLVGSKYVQSDVQHCYEQVKQDLGSGKIVLFSGVPCQVAALKNYLGKNYNNLLCIDMVCHGVPSPRVFRDYLNYLSKKFESFPQKVYFRYKKPGWSVFSMRVEFENGKVYQATKFDDPYLIFFLKDLILRPSCHLCCFTSQNRVGDITLADFWKYQADIAQRRGTEKGVNLVVQLKGIAVLMLMYHHLFLNAERAGRCFFFTGKIGMQMLIYTAGFGKICVSIFLILSGYGINESSEKLIRGGVHT